MCQCSASDAEANVRGGRHRRRGGGSGKTRGSRSKVVNRFVFGNRKTGCKVNPRDHWHGRRGSCGGRCDCGYVSENVTSSLSLKWFDAHTHFTGHVNLVLTSASALHTVAGLDEAGVNPLQRKENSTGILAYSGKWRVASDHDCLNTTLSQASKHLAGVVLE
jgi:hypothetical protein